VQVQVPVLPRLGADVGPERLGHERVVGQRARAEAEVWRAGEAGAVQEERVSAGADRPSAGIWRHVLIRGVRRLSARSARR